MALVSGQVAVAAVASLLAFLAFPLYTGFVVKLVRDARAGKRDNALGKLFAEIVPSALPLASFGVLSTIGLLLGFAFFVIPGFFLLTFWAVGPAAIVNERLGGIKGFSRSWDLVGGEGIRVFGVIAIVTLISVAFGFISPEVLEASGASEFASVAFLLLANALTMPIYAIAVGVLYFKLSRSTTELQATRTP